MTDHRWKVKVTRDDIQSLIRTARAVCDPVILEVTGRQRYMLRLPSRGRRVMYTGRTRAAYGFRCGGTTVSTTPDSGCNSGRYIHYPAFVPEQQPQNLFPDGNVPAGDNPACLGFL